MSDSVRDRLLVRIGARWATSGLPGDLTKNEDVERAIRQVDATLPHPFQGKNHLECDLCGKSEPNPRYHPREVSVQVMESALFEIADKVLNDLGYIAPEDIAMQRTKVFEGLLTAIRTADRDRIYQVFRIDPPAATKEEDDGA